MRMIRAGRGRGATIGALVGGLLVGGGLLGSAATAGASPTGGAIQVWGTPAAVGGGGNVVITGAIADSGKVESLNAAGKKDANGDYKLLELKHGTILLNGTTLDKVLNAAAPTAFDAGTCSGSFSGTAPMPIVRGTKAYAGISGTVDITVTFAVILPLDKGKCNPNTNANPVAQYGSIAGTGTVAF